MQPTDLISFDTLLTADEIAFRDRVRAFVDETIRPNIVDWYERAVFPREIVAPMAELGLLGLHLDGYGCAGRSSVEYGLAAAEVEAGDSGLRTFMSVQGSLAMTAIHKHGSEEQKQEWLPHMAAGEAIGCFALTEPGAGSDPANMTTFARRDGDDWIITGAKRWIGLASIADVAVVWAQTDDGVRGFVVPTTTPGFTATPIEPKLSMRASVQCDLDRDARVVELADRDLVVRERAGVLEAPELQGEEEALVDLEGHVDELLLCELERRDGAVSYTHLTLPTKA